VSAFFFYYHNNNPLNQKSIDDISKGLVHFPWVKVEMYSNDNLQLVYTVNKTDGMQVFRSKEDNLTFFLQGNIFESSKGIEKIDEDNEEYTLENQIIKRYLKNGVSSCVGLNGIYNLLIWNDRTSVLEIGGDRLGILQVFFAPLGNGHFVATSDIITLKSIPGYGPKINKRGIFDLLYMGIAFENRTVLEGVERLLPNACYRISSGQLRLIDEFKLSFSKERWGYVIPKILDELEYCYVQAIKRQLSPEDKIVFFQSGGKDSRFFSYFLKQAGVIPHCVTMGENHHGEVFLSKAIDKTLGFPWKRTPVTQNYEFTYVQQYLRMSNFSVRIAPIYQIEAISKLSRDVDYVTSTYMGDLIFGKRLGECKLEKANNTYDALNNYFEFLREALFPEEALEKLFPKSGQDWIIENRREAIDVFIRLGNEPYQTILAYDLRSVGRFKLIGMMRSIYDAFPMSLPCIDNDLMDFTFSLPPSLLGKKLILDIFLMQRASNLAAIPLDQNSFNFLGLIPSLRTQLKFKLWHSYVEKVKLPTLRAVSPVSSTTQFYFDVFSLQDKGFQEVKNKAFSAVPCLEGILDIPTAVEILKRPLPSGIDHITPSNALRSLIAVIFTAESFRG